jgi:hypothetical protein
MNKYHHRWHLDDLQEINQNGKDDFHRARATIQTLATEKDQLGLELDAKTAENLHLIQELNMKIRKIDESNLTINDLEAALE